MKKKRKIKFSTTISFTFSLLIVLFISFEVYMGFVNVKSAGEYCIDNGWESYAYSKSTDFWDMEGVGTYDFYCTRWVDAELGKHFEFSGKIVIDDIPKNYNFNELFMELE